MTTASNLSSNANDKFDGVASHARAIVDAGQEKLGEAKDMIIGAKDKVIDKAESLGSKLAKLVKEHPFAAVGVAFGVGYVAMRLMRR